MCGPETAPIPSRAGSAYLFQTAKAILRPTWKRIGDQHCAGKCRELGRGRRPSRRLLRLFGFVSEKQGSILDARRAGGSSPPGQTENEASSATDAAANAGLSLSRTPKSMPPARDPARDRGNGGRQPRQAITRNGDGHSPWEHPEPGVCRVVQPSAIVYAISRVV